MGGVEWEGAHPKCDVLISILEVPLGDLTLFFIPHEELLTLGYESLEDFSIVRCNGRFFELQGFSEPLEAWWVEEIKLPDGLEPKEEPSSGMDAPLG